MFERELGASADSRFRRAAEAVLARVRGGQARDEGPYDGRIARYHAFISYSHDADGEFGPRLRDALHRFARPWNRRRALHVFCDRRTMAANENLWSTIEAAITASDHFILLASPASAESHWVRRELETWKRVRGGRGLLIGRTGGVIAWDRDAAEFDWDRTTALPETLRGWFEDEPLWVDLIDLRKESELSVKNPLFLDRLADFAAVLHGKPKDELVGEDIRQDRIGRRIRRGGTAALVLLTVLALVAGGFAGVQLRVAREQSRTAVSRAVAAQSVTLRPKSPGKSMLAAVAAWRLAPTAEARGALLEAQVQHFAGRLVGHKGAATGTAVSADGHTIATSGADGTVRLWDLASRAAVATLDEHRGSVHALAFHPTDPNLLVAVDDEGGVQWWDVGRRTSFTVSDAHRGAIFAVAFSRDGRLLATGGDDRSIRLWDTATGSPVGDRLTGHEKAVTDVSFTSDGRTLASAANDRTARLWDVASGRAVRTVSGHRHYVNAARFAFDDRKLITVGHDSTGVVLDLESGERTVLAGHVDAVSGLAIDPTGRLAATTGYDSTIRLWDVESGRLVRTLLGSAGVVDGPSFTPDGATLVVAHADGPVTLWDLRGSVFLHTDYVTAVDLTGDGRLMATGGIEQTIRLWNVPEHRQIGRLDAANHGQVTGLAFDSAGTLLASAGLGYSVRIWDVGRKALVKQLGDGSFGSMMDVAFSPDDRLLATADFEGAVRLWEVGTWRQIRVLRGDGSPITKVVFSADGETVVATDYTTLHAWHTRTGREIAALRGHAEPMTGVAIAADNRTVATTSHDSTVRLWDLATRRELAVLQGHTASTDKVAFTPDGTVLASASWDSTVRLWSVPTRTPMAVFNAHSKNARGVVFADDGTTVATVSADFTAMVWSIDPERAAERICAVLARDITPAEWAELVPGQSYRRVCA